ncbi:hypothetical protein BH11BAC7_BH11BAC7_24400 [soil metagenome]
MEDYKAKVGRFSNEQLNDYIENRYKYIPEIVHAALNELQKRGRIFSAEELELIYADTEIKAGDENFQSGIRDAVTDARELPEYYSPMVIRIFSVLFSVLFGSILMAMNLSRTPEKKGVYEAVIFGVIYTTAIMIIGNYLPANGGGIGIVFNIAGGFMIEYFFWNKYIGTETPYVKRSFVKPLITGLIITGLLLLLMLR